MKRLNDQSGFTIVEVLVASVVLITGLLAVSSMFGVSKSATLSTRARVQATNLGREMVEAARSVAYNDITDAAILAEIADGNPALADMVAGAPYTIERRNTVFTITSETCVVDDARDGGGASPRTGDFCLDSVAPGTLDPRNGKPDTVPEDYKRVDIIATYKRPSGAVISVKQTTLVNNPGSAGAPAIVTLASPAVGTPPVVGPTVANGSSTTTSIAFSITTTQAPYSLIWLLDGVNKAPICGGQGVGSCPNSKGPFNFSWDLESPKADDGPYLLSAEAYDERSVAGPSRSMTVVLNRSYPRAPAGLAGGRNVVDGAPVVELEWGANPERDLTGYVVSRIEANGSKTVVCPRASALYCRDTSPPDLATVRYQVVAWDVTMDGVTPRESIYSSTVDVIRANQPPRDPENVVKAAPDANGHIAITWDKPSPQDPDTGDSIAFYRVYRDGQLLADRLGRVDAAGATTHSFLDGNPQSSSHRYYVTSVDMNFAESGFREAQP